MRTNAILAIICLALCPCTAGEIQEIERLERIRDTLRESGLEGVIKLVGVNGWAPPVIPSHWKIERERDDSLRRIGTTARSLGRDLVNALDELAPKMRPEPVTVGFYQQAWQLTELARWIASREGYGNGFVAQRAIDLAAVASARITAAIDKNVGNYRELADRLHGPWEAVEWRAAALNRELGQDAFVARNQDDLGRVWDSGSAAIARARLKNGSGGRLDIANAEFYEDSDTATRKTVSGSWGDKRHERLVRGLETNNVIQAIGLAEFRSIVGYFPERPTTKSLTPTQREAIEWQKKHYPESIGRGAKSNFFASETKEAFAQAWQERVITNGGLVTDDVNREMNRYIAAWLAFERLRNGTFIDSDAENADKSPR